MTPAARNYIVGLLTGSGIGLIVGWVLNSEYWYNGSTRSTPIVGGITAVLCGAGVVIHSLGRRSAVSVAAPARPPDA